MSPRKGKKDESPEPVVAADVEATSVPKKAAARTGVQSVVYKAVEHQPFVGRYLTVTVLGDQTVTLEVNVPQEVVADVAAALVDLESPHYVIEPA